MILMKQIGLTLKAKTKTSIIAMATICSCGLITAGPKWLPSLLTPGDNARELQKKARQISEGLKTLTSVSVCVPDCDEGNYIRLFSYSASSEERITASIEASWRGTCPTPVLHTCTAWSTGASPLQRRASGCHFFPPFSSKKKRDKAELSLMNKPLHVDQSLTIREQKDLSWSIFHTACMRTHFGPMGWSSLEKWSPISSDQSLSLEAAFGPTNHHCSI